MKKHTLILFLSVIFLLHAKAQTITKEEIECIDALILAKAPGTNFKAEIDYRTLIMACNDSSFFYNKNLVIYYLDTIKTNDSIRNHFYGMLNYYYSGYKDILATKLVVYELVKDKYKQVNNESSLLKFVDLICLSTYNHNDYIKSTIDTNFYYTLKQYSPIKDSIISKNDSSIYTKSNMPILEDDKNIKRIKISIEYPKYEKEHNIEGLITVTFVIERDGQICDVGIMKKVSPGLDCEAMRIIKLMPNWNPIIKDGKPICRDFNIPINFKLQ